MGTRVHAFGDDVLGHLDAVGVAELIRTRQISPEEAVDAAIARVERVNPILNAVAFADFDGAREQASGSSTAAPFAGVPSFVKDNLDVPGMPTRSGSAAVRAHPATTASGPTKQFLSAGYVLLGKTTLPEFGLLGSAQWVDRPPTCNPWNTAYPSGGSSGGSAALVAAGAIPLAHGNDGGGSIRIPAAINGLVGLKTTTGRLIDQDGANLLPINIVTEGVLTRTVRDTAHHLAAMESFRHNRKLPPIGLVEGPASRRLRVGVSTTSPSGRPVDAAVMAVIDEAAQHLAGLGHEVVEVQLPAPATMSEDFTTYWELFAFLMTAAAFAHHKQYFDRSRLEPFTCDMARRWVRRPWAVAPAVRRLKAWGAASNAVFDEVDVLLTPTLLHPTNPLEHLDPGVPTDELIERWRCFTGFTQITNISGGPALALPFGQSDAGLPIGIQLASAPGTESTLLEIGYEIEASRPFPQITHG